MPKKSAAPENPPVNPAPAAPPAPAPVSGVVTVTADDLVSSVVMPAPSEHAIAAIQADAAPASAPNAPAPSPAPVTPGLHTDVDARGTPFDPARHKRERDKNGNWISAKVGRPKGSKSAAPANSPSVVGGAETPGTAPAVPGMPQEDKFDLAAELYCRTFYNIAGMAFNAGDEWQPRDSFEHLGNKQATAAYLRSTNSPDLPPGWALVLTVGTYAALRLQMPKTQETIKKAVLAMKRMGGNKPEQSVSALPINPEKQTTPDNDIAGRS